MNTKGVIVMKRLHTGVFSALALISAAAAQQANAQSFRVEGQAGVSQFHSEGNHHSKFGVGAAAGVDFNLGGNVVAGAEGTFWWAPQENETVDGGGFADHKTFQEWGIHARLGYLLAPSTLIY